MSNEANVISSLYFKKGNNTYRTPSGSFRADVADGSGPSPGLVSALTTGTQVSLAGLTLPGFCEIRNLGTTAGQYVEYGIFDPVARKFYPLGELLPGEGYVLRLSRNIQEDYVGPGTGTHAGAEGNRLMLLAHGATTPCLVNAFEK